ncbi:MAG: hypothetical protein WC742_04855 [Gallionellaceae bacterium]
MIGDALSITEDSKKYTKQRLQPRNSADSNANIWYWLSTPPEISHGERMIFIIFSCEASLLRRYSLFNNVSAAKMDIAHANFYVQLKISMIAMYIFLKIARPWTFAIGISRGVDSLPMKLISLL